MDQVFDFTRSLKSKLTILQINTKRYTRENEKKLQEVESLLKTRYEDFPIEFETVYSDEIVNTLNRQMSSGKADVLALCTVDHGFFEGIFHQSTIKALSLLADYPLLIVHA
jgi:hypothetical protein